MINIPAAMIVLGGTLGATLASTSMEQIKNIPALYKKAMSTEPPDYRGEIDRIVAFAEKARREGLLALDAEVGEIEDEFLRKGMQLVVDGTDPELVREILEAEIDGMEHRHKAGASARSSRPAASARRWACSAPWPALVHVLENLDKPETLGHSIAGAFIATLYGVGSANVFYYPVANRLKLLSAQEAGGQDDDPRGRPGDPGRREPAPDLRPPHDVRAARRARRPRRTTAPTTARPWRRPRSPMAGSRKKKARRTRTRSTPTSAGC